MTRKESFAHGHPIDIPIRQSHLVELDWMADQRVSLSFTTYQTGKLFFVGRKPDHAISEPVNLFGRRESGEINKPP